MRVLVIFLELTVTCLANTIVSYSDIKRPKASGNSLDFFFFM